ncbi:hypothetical protein NAT51_14995 [Flavobacterium amniphilum]|uniref:hypothetical protein n=1 Tax=Flavobacterium amniphilum TaxID=1834035 RepID=UPI00202A55EB|nr:hypothetical protein [Flavobacterium amniphilum]MCL9806840.1 hypothetical protein [Flavobacterium amniphilum]
MNHLQKLLLFVGILSLQGCIQSQHSLFSDFEDDFHYAAGKAKAKPFKYQYDKLSPQTSYLVDCKLRFLTFETSGELTDKESLVEFENDSVTKIIEHFTIYAGNDNGETAGRDSGKIEADTIYYSDFKNEVYKIYVNNIAMKSSKPKDYRIGNDYLYNVKKATERSYDCPNP